MEDVHSEIRVGLVGYGYWGPNLARVFSRQPNCRVAAVCETDPDKANLAARHYPQAYTTRDFQDLISDPEIDAIVIATPVGEHYAQAEAAIQADKDVCLEKPMTSDLARAEELIELTERSGRILLVDHVFLYTGAVRKIKEIVDTGELGDFIFLDSVRVNLGLFQEDVNVIWDLAVHDLSIATYVLDADPVTVQVVGRSYGTTHESIAYIHLSYPDGLVAHLHVNWVSPVKIRQMLIAGSKKMIVYDDMENSEKVKVYDKGIIVRQSDEDALNKMRIDYRTGDMWAPKLDNREALDAMAENFLQCVRERRQPASDGRFGLRIMRQLEACQRSLDEGGSVVEVGAP